ncbi:hypothetical protein SAMN05216268_10281 [Streptomyces yunnanensis]|uniref:Uncharacterized protein n=1 Tax=Streptomyces yunnanensis TaxID=156453 RepID=A0A9X8MKW0_9ACTN|nr:hypothetical protein SAMN05216268_10281 [Streptomyces yunnanensis]
MGTSLMRAGNEIRKIAADLKGHVDQVHWEGEGAEAFRTWSRDTVTESHKLADYAHTAGSAMTDSATALGRAKLMPKPKPTSNSVELDPGKAGPTTNLLKDPDRDAAVAEMNRLSSYYRNAQERIARQEQPNFRPASGFLPEPEEHYGDQYRLVGGSTGGQAMNRAVNAEAATPRGSSFGKQSATASEPSPGGLRSDGRISTSLDTAPPAVLPQAPSAGKSSPPLQSGSSQESPSTFVPGTVTPTNPASRLTRPGDTLQGPATDRASTVERPHVTAPKDGVVGGTARRSNALDAPRIPTGTVMGEERGLIPPRSNNSTSAPHLTEGGTSATGREDLRQRLAAPRGGSAQVPRGPVMGEEPGATTHGTAGTGYPGPVGSAMREGSRSAPGRRLAFEPGGPVGSTSSSPIVDGEPGVRATGPWRNTGGSASSAETARSGSRVGDFTPGGTGLRRDPSGNEVLPMGSGPSSKPKRRISNERPHYLQEDDESWTSSQPSVVPPVIGEDTTS